MNLEQFTEKVIEMIADKKAENIVSIDVSGENTYTDRIIICTGGSDLHVRAIAENILDYCKSEHIKVLSKEGLEARVWILIDFGNLILHIFREDLRKHYNLEKLWIERDAQINHIERTYA